MSDDLKPDADTAAEWSDAEAKWEAQLSETSIPQDVVGGFEAVGEAVIDATASVVDMFRPKHVEAEVPDLSDIPMTPEETTMRSTSVAHEEAPPDPGRS